MVGLESLNLDKIYVPIPVICAESDNIAPPQRH